MFIKFDELDLFEFFENEPTIIGEYEEGNWMYFYVQNDFEIVLLISTYEMYVEISITYNDNIIYRQKYKNVREIKKIDSDNLRLLLDEESTVIIKKEPQVGVIVEWAKK